MLGLDVSFERFYKDPTFWFTVSVILVPLVFSNSVNDAVAYLTTPMMLMSYLTLYVFLYTVHGGECLELSGRDLRVANWFLFNGVYFNLFLDVVSGQFQMMDEMTRQYNKVEPRYALGVYHDAGAPVFMTSMCELFFQSPLCLVTYYAYCRGKPYRRISEFTVCVLHAAGVWWFYIPEIIGGFQHLGGWPKSMEEAISFHRLLFFWFGFWFCGSLWLYVPFQIGRTAWVEISSAFNHKKTY
mmetsp:Transcript_17733/g.28693  ORF Transcript_17733/g.28693 Transcript_17733/m.28693 type:complete len:241 (+) Transcript_17733:353-1075(+)